MIEPTRFPKPMKASTIPLELSGENGGGQLLRSALTLSLITGRPFRMRQIRAKRRKPGLMRQHLTCVNAAAVIGDAKVGGASPGSTELDFEPGAVTAGEYSFAIGSGGSTSLVLQTLLPALLQAAGPSTLRIEGGTHNPLAPPFEFIEHCYLPALARMGVEASVSLERHGFMQAGGGRIHASIQPLKQWRKPAFTERGRLLDTSGTILHAHMPETIMRREAQAAAGILGWPLESISPRDASDSPGPGNAILLQASFEQACAISSGIATFGKTAESVAAGAAKGLRGYLASPAPIDVHLADQLVLPMALAGGGLLHTRAISDHTRTNIELIEAFLPVRFHLSEPGPGVRAIEAVAE